MRNRLNQHGSVDPLLVPLIICAVLGLALAAFAAWSFVNYLDQKNNTDEKIAEAVVEAEAVQREELEVEFAEREKQPNKTFVSSASIGSISITYPKTWSVFADEEESGSNPLNAFFHPGYVPANDTLYALRVEVDESDYANEIDDYEKDIEDGAVTSRAVETAGVVGTRFDGQIDDDFSGALVVYPLRDKTVKIWTESPAFLADFDNTVLANLSFEP